ncbi:hypothetical protein BC936DRAFT_138249 [Jimgerdemannia flammicorona]|uniref:Uncharacterized protein n=1 Tax=Jimgerdemannia flammicorona TaxID=994334 RepID=A0A433CVD3_9FUNG|nr:hypothetical protein BC936DRAFT_138249 [Jimgerdemannia flammicorona]
MMRLNGGAGSLERDGLDDVRIECPLEEVLDFSAAGFLVNLCGLCFEHFDEGIANNLALALRVRHAGQAPKEQRRGVHHLDVDTHLVTQHLLDGRALVQTHHTVVDQDRVEAGGRMTAYQRVCTTMTRTSRIPIANGLVHQLGGDGRVDTTGDSANNLADGTDDGTDTLDLRVDEGILKYMVMNDDWDVILPDEPSTSSKSPTM